MNKALCLTILLLTVISIAVAQSPATIKKSDNDTLCQSQRIEVEIIGINGDHFNHPQHPENGIMCPFVKSFKTNGYFAWYQWESSFEDNIINDPEYIMVDIDSSGYIKVTVWDNSGNVGSDSIWFNVRSNEVPPMEDFIMEIDDDLHANFYGITTEDHHKLHLRRGYEPGQFTPIGIIILSPGEWSFIDTTTYYSNDSLWIYGVRLFDRCGSSISYLVPGVLLGTYERCLTIKSILQDDVAPMFYENYNFEYFIYTIDEHGDRHVFNNNGEPVILQPEATSWYIPGPHIDPYYQVGVVRIREDGSYELLSLSNKVSNPWPDTDDINEGEEESFAIFPNPSHGQVTVVGTGILTIWNPNGQKIFQQEVDGEISIELPTGIYISRLSTEHGNYHKKIVVY